MKAVCSMLVAKGLADKVAAAIEESSSGWYKLAHVSG